MLRGYRGIGIAALVAALAITFFLGTYVTELANPKHSERYQAYQNGQGDETKTTTPVANVPQAIVQYTPCKDPKSETQSDLCAQWRAAKAAEKSANWTMWGVLASMAGISLLLWQIILTREAVQDTGRATDAMRQANEIARDSAAKQLRPYVAFAPVEDLSDNESLTSFGLREKTFQIQIVNFGQTPARKVNVSSGSCCVDVPVKSANPALEERHGIGQIAPSAKIPISFDFYKMSDDEIAAVRDGTKAILFRFSVEYEFAPGQMDCEDITLFVIKEHFGRAKQGHLLTDYQRQWV